MDTKALNLVPMVVEQTSRGERAYRGGLPGRRDLPLQDGRRQPPHSLGLPAPGGRWPLERVAPARAGVVVSFGGSILISPYLSHDDPTFSMIG